MVPGAGSTPSVLGYLLPQYYRRVTTLETYLAEQAPETLASAAPLAPLLPGALCLVDTEMDWEGVARLEAEGGACPLVALVQLAQRAILAQCAAGRRRMDVLTLGYRHDAEAGIVNTHPNTLVTSIVTGAAWHTLLARMGVRRFYRMLRTTAYFWPLPDTDDCYVQLWGELLSERPRTAEPGRTARKRPAAYAEGPRKRRKPAKQPSTEAEAPPAPRPPHREKPPPSAHVLRRARLFYARPARRYRYGIVLGVPPGHVLTTPGPMHVRTACLARQMFAAHFRTRGGRWPRCLRRVRPLLASLLRRHDRMHYASALEACCPTTLPRAHAARRPPAPTCETPPTRTGGAAALAAPALPRDSATTRQLQQLAHARSHGEPQFYQYATSHGRVCWWVRVLLHRVVPCALLGSPANRRVVVRAATRLVCARRHERVALHEALHGFRTRDCAWLVSQTHAACSALVRALIAWVLEAFVVPVLRTTFYVTEAAAFRQRVLYFRQDVWARLSAPLVARLRDTLFVRVPRAAGAPVAQVRLLPKHASIRPIVNLRRRTLGVSVNAQLQTALDVLALEAARHPDACGAAVHGANGIHARLRAFREALMHRFGRVPMLYAVRADVRAAFDSLDHAQLLERVRALLPATAAYVVQRYTQLKPGLGRVTKHSVRRAFDDAAYPQMLATRPAARHAVLVDHTTYTLTDATHVLRQIETHITRSLVRLGRDWFRQRVGVPQGSVLATLLCNVLLGHIERTHLAHLDGCLMRYTDDFLLLTHSHEEAVRFCETLYSVFPLHGCAIAPEKTLVNFDLLVQDTLVPRIDARAPMPWCGFAICPTSLAVCADKQRYPYHFGDTLTVHTAHAGDALLQRMLHAVRARTHVLYTDPQLNTSQGAYANLLEGFVVSAAKLHAYLRALRPSRMTHAFVWHVIAHAVRATYPMVVARARLAHTACAVRRDAVEWLGYLGFYVVLAPRPAYAALRAALHSTLAQRAAPRRALGRWAVPAAYAHAQNVYNRC